VQLLTKFSFVVAIFAVIAVGIGDRFELWVRGNGASPETRSLAIALRERDRAKTKKPVKQPGRQHAKKTATR
jgi:hypothetical protein